MYCQVKHLTFFAFIEIFRDIGGIIFETTLFDVHSMGSTSFKNFDNLCSLRFNVSPRSKFLFVFTLLCVVCFSQASMKDDTKLRGSISQRNVRSREISEEKGTKNGVSFRSMFYFLYLWLLQHPFKQHQNVKQHHSSKAFVHPCAGYQIRLVCQKVLNEVVTRSMRKFAYGIFCKLLQPCPFPRLF